MDKPIMNKPIRLSFLLSILLWGAGLFPSMAQTSSDFLKRFASSMELGTKVSLFNKDAQLASYALTIIPTYNISDKWYIGPTLEGNFLADHTSSIIVSKSFNAGYVVGYSFGDINLGIRQGFCVYSTAPGRFDTEVSGLFYYPDTRNAYIRIGAGYSQPYQLSEKGFVFLSASIGVRAFRR